MKKFLVMILTLALLCGAAFAETPAAGTLDAALEQAMQLLLSGDTEAILARMNMDMKQNAVAVLTQIRALGAAEEITLNDTAEQGGCFAGEFTVLHGGKAYTYALVLDQQGKIGAVSVEEQISLAETELDEGIDFEARVHELIGLLLRGDYDAFIPELNAGVAGSVDAQLLADLMTAYGDVEMYAVIYMMQSQGYHQAVIEFRAANGIGQWQLALDGAGDVAGLYLADKVPDRQTMSEKDSDNARSEAVARLEMLLSGDYASFREDMLADMAAQLTDDALAGFADMGAYTALTVHDMWHKDGVTGVDVIADHESQAILYSLILDGEGTLVGFGHYPVIFLSAGA